MHKRYTNIDIHDATFRRTLHHSTICSEPFLLRKKKKEFREINSLQKKNETLGPMTTMTGLIPTVGEGIPRRGNLSEI